MERVASPRKAKYRVKLTAPIGTAPTYVWVAEKVEVMVCQTEEGLRVMASLCPHMGARLVWNASRGAVLCPWHGLAFHGKPLKSDHPRYRMLCEYAGEVIDGELLIYENT